MSPFYIELSGREVTAPEVDAFEKRHALTLPDDYRKFLLMTNGGMFNPQMHLQTELGFVCPFEFYALNDQHPYDLDRMCKSLDWEEGYALGYLQIGRDPGGSAFFISTRGSDRGCIYFLDREADPMLPSDLLKVASSFRQMLASLRPSEDQE